MLCINVPQVFQAHGLIIFPTVLSAPATLHLGTHTVHLGEPLTGLIGALGNAQKTL